MVAGEKNLRNFSIFPEIWLGVVGVLEEAVGKTLLRRTLQLPHHAGQEPDHGIEEDEGGRFAARENIVADRDLPQVAALSGDAAQKLIETLIEDMTQ